MFIEKKYFCPAASCPVRNAGHNGQKIGVRSDFETSAPKDCLYQISCFHNNLHDF